MQVIRQTLAVCNLMDGALREQPPRQLVRFLLFGRVRVGVEFRLESVEHFLAANSEVEGFFGALG